MKLAVAALLAMMLVSPIYTGAQGVTPSPTEPDASPARTAVAENDGRNARLITLSNGAMEGRLHLHADTARVSSDQRSWEIPLTDIDRMWVQRGTFALTGGLVAGIPCAVVGAVVGAGLASDTEGVRAAHPVGGALVGGAISGVACGLVGAGIGALFKRWPLEYVRPPKLASR